jgi:hypothetical protein
LVRPADIVTLDRVINVYPGWERLARLAAGRVFFRPGDAIERIARENGLAPHVAHDVGPAWKVVVFRRE